MLSRTDALRALGGERFDVVVIGGGITGAGVALDAASRGYSVALVERDDYASGTSSRSSKMVHGGLRYLQNFDLGLVREALLERQLMVELAPHLVYPTPFLVPTPGEERRNWRIGIGLNMYDVMATTRVGQGRRERQARERASKERASFEHSAHLQGRNVTTVPGEEAGADPGAGLRDPGRPTCSRRRTDDARLVLTVLEAERFGGCSNRAEVVADSDGASVRAVCTDSDSGERFEVGPTTWSTRPEFKARIRPRRSSPRRVLRIAPSRGTTSRSPSTSFLLQAACIVPGLRTIFALLVRAGIDRHTDRDYDGDIVRQPSGEDVSICSRRSTRSSALTRAADVTAPTRACGR
jgi:glycerol-3-phosphate dehydrogenase